MPFVPLQTPLAPAQPHLWLLSHQGKLEKGLSSSDPHPAGSAQYPDQHGQCRLTPWPKGTTAPSLCRTAPPAWGLAGSMEREPGVAAQAGTDTLTWGKALWEAGMTLEKSKAAFVCLQGGIHEKKKPLSAGTCSGHAALSPAQPHLWLLSHQGKMEKGLSSSDPLPAGSDQYRDQHGQCRLTPWPKGTTALSLCREHCQLGALQGAWRRKQERPARPAQTRLHGERLSGGQG